MKTPKVLFIAILLLTGFAKADVVGSWTGTVAMTCSDGDTDGGDFTFGVVKQENNLTFQDPEGWTLIGDMPLTVDGSNIMFYGHQVGT
ncbi:MAG: hypothetical protein V4736_13180 [Bdellovibrionota bacterium]